MQTRPDAFSDEMLDGALRSHWGLEPTRVTYLPVGFGSHHWQVEANGTEWLVTVDDLAARLHASAGSVEEAFGALRAALTTAAALRNHGLEFVVAPRGATDGEVLCRVGDVFAQSVYPWTVGRSRGFGDQLTAGERRQVLDLLVELHTAPASVRTSARGDDFELPSRDELETALSASGGRWDTGPYGDRARALLAEHAGHVDELLRRYDTLVPFSAESDRVVITHGEPHAGNLLETDGGWRLVDWDTTLIAPPERDLWMLAADDAATVCAYERSTGRHVLPEVLTLYRLRWLATDIALFVRDFRRQHGDTDDVRIAWAALQAFLTALPETLGR